MGQECRKAGKMSGNFTVSGEWSPWAVLTWYISLSWNISCQLAELGFTPTDTTITFCFSLTSPLFRSLFRSGLVLWKPISGKNSGVMFNLSWASCPKYPYFHRFFPLFCVCVCKLKRFQLQGGGLFDTPTRGSAWTPLGCFAPQIPIIGSHYALAMSSAVLLFISCWRLWSNPFSSYL